MPSAIPTTGTSSVLPPLAAREQTSAKLTELVEAVLRHLQMQGSNKHPTLYHIWDFAMRTDYILSELDNIENGRPLRFPDQIPDLAGCRSPSPAKAKELAVDVRTRSITIQMMLNDSQGKVMLAMMGLPDVDFGDEIKRKADELVESLDAWEQK